MKCKRCKFCKKLFVPNKYCHKEQIYCSASHRNRYYYINNLYPEVKPRIRGIERRVKLHLPKDKKEEILKENLRRIEEGKPLTMPLRVLNGDLKLRVLGFKQSYEEKQRKAKKKQREIDYPLRKIRNKLREIREKS